MYSTRIERIESTVSNGFGSRSNPVRYLPMTTWICPFCDARMNVKSQLVGETRPCANCNQESEITDADAVPPLPAELFDDAPRPRKSRRAAPAAPILSSSNPGGDSPVAMESLTSVSLAYGLLIIIAVCSGLCIVGGVAGGGDAAPAIQLGFTGLASVVVAWPIYTIANETFRSRRLLEQILKQQK